MGVMGLQLHLTAVCLPFMNEYFTIFRMPCRYRVRRGTTPGTFFYSVLDNGVTSNEYWRIMDCANDLTWCLFYYSGAAATAGLSYNGAVLATVDGRWPEKYTARVHEALGRAGIEPWELSSVDNSNCVGAPL
jgi:hypothetical protein